MEKSKTKESSTKAKQSLPSELPNQKIIATWLERDKEAVYAHFGWGYPIKKHATKAPKISNFATNEDYQELHNNVIALQKYKGVYQLLGDFETERLVGFLKKEFRDFTVWEIWSAMDLAAAPDNPLKLPHGGRTFNEFNNDYFTRILAPYRIYRQTLLGKYNEVAAGGDQAGRDIYPDQPKTKPETDLNFDKQFCHSTFEAVVNNQAVAGLHIAYDILHKHGFIQFTKEREDNARRQAQENLRVNARKECRGGGPVQIYDIVGRSIDLNSLQLEYKRVAVRGFFNELKQQGKTVEHLWAPQRENSAMATA